ncbi:nuclear transport factor 2 family protein [Actinomycetospora sp.]|uniref:nuclear transport factor 2 family protein n=1 Tax=Actinomycetospora sp. TaxID=1872135 RepID=UPI002F3F1C2D
MTDVDDLADRLALHELVARHGHLVDAGDLAALDEVFLPDVVYDVTDLGGTAMAGLVEVEAAARRLGDGNPVGHHVTNVVVTSLNEDGARVLSKGLGVAGDGTVGSVDYNDEAVRTAEGWRISRRTVRARRSPLRP